MVDFSQEAIDRAERAAQVKKLDDETAKKINEATIRAKYKIEIKFRHDRKLFGDNSIGWQAYESGKHLHGGGDELIYWCLARKGEGGCGAPIIGSNIIQGVALCTNCHRQLNAEMLTSNFIIRMTIKRLAEETAKLWRRLEGSADIYCKYSPEDFRYKIMEEKVGSVKAKALQGLFIYPLANIIKDTSAGSSLESRFESFFKA
jgi:hypothetical protein